MAKKRPLTARQKRFCDQYLLCMNASEAARRAGYSEKTAGTIGQQNLQKLDIKEYIDQRKDAEEELLGINRLTILQNLQTSIRINAQEVEADGGVKVEVDTRAKIAAINELNKMMPGYHAPQRQANADGSNLPPPVTQINYLPPAGGDHA